MEDKETWIIIGMLLFCLICWKVGYWEGQKESTYDLTNEDVSGPKDK